MMSLIKSSVVAAAAVATFTTTDLVAPVPALRMRAMQVTGSALYGGLQWNERQLDLMVWSMTIRNLQEHQALSHQDIIILVKWLFTECPDFPTRAAMRDPAAYNQWMDAVRSSFPEHVVGMEEVLRNMFFTDLLPNRDQLLATDEATLAVMNNKRSLQGILSYDRLGSRGLSWKLAAFGDYEMQIFPAEEHPEINACIHSGGGIGGFTKFIFEGPN